MPSRSLFREGEQINQEGTNNIPFSEDEKVEDADDYDLTRPEDLKEVAQRELDEAKAKFEVTKKLHVESIYKFDSDFEHAHRSLGPTMNTNYPGLFENPSKYEKDPSSIIRALARRRRIVLQLAFELNKIEDEMRQAQRALEFATFHPSQLLPMMDNLQDQINEQNKGIRQLNAELITYQNYNKRHQQQKDENKDRFNAVIFEFEQKVGENGSQLKSKNEEMLDELKKLQTDQKEQFNRDIAQMRSLVGMQQQVQEHDINEIRIEFENHQQVSTKSDEWESEYKSRFEQQKYQDQQTESKFNKEISEIRSIINSITQKQSNNTSQFQDLIQEMKKHRALRELREEEESNQIIEFQLQQEEDEQQRIALENEQKRQQEFSAQRPSPKHNSKQPVAKRASISSTTPSQLQKPAAAKLEHRYSSSQSTSTAKQPAKQPAKADRYASHDQTKVSATSPRSSVNSQRFASVDQARSSQTEKPNDQSRPTRPVKAQPQPQQTRSISKGRPSKAK